MSYYNEEKPNIVIDNGSSSIKVGFDHDDVPRSIFPAVVGRPRHDSAIINAETKDRFVGNDVQEFKDLLSLEYPIQRGIVTNWDDMETIWSHAFHNCLHINPEEYPVMITEAVLNPKGNRECMTQVMFETFNIPAFHIGTQAALAIYSPGRSIGIVLDCGDGVTQIIPVWEGYPIANAIRRLDLAGSDVTRYLQKLLYEKGYSFSTASELETVREMKERICYTALDFQKEIAIEQNYTLPDGQTISVGNESFQSSDILFQPSLMGKALPGVHELLFESIMACDCDIRRDLFTNIILSGGVTLNQGFCNRIVKELHMLKPPSQKIKVIAPPERFLSLWNGAAIVASMCSFQEYLIPKSEYDEVGPSVMHRWCV